MASGRPTILVVDDNAETRAFLCKQLARDYRVLEASNGREGWSKIRSESPSLVLTDDRMPKMDGHALCRRVKSSPEVPPIPVVLLRSADAGPAGPGAASSAPDEVLHKPFDVEALHRCVGRYVWDGAAVPGSFLVRLLTVVEDNLDDPEFTTRRLADALSLSRRHLTRQVKRSAGMPPAALIRRRRIDRAKRKLRRSPESIAGVAEEVGFRSASHFSQVFRELVGCSPSTHRDRHE